MTVYIIGAGMAGLSAAFAAVKEKHTVVVLEASAHIGGRCYSFYDEELGALLDNGTHLMTGANTALLDMLAECQTDTPLQSIGTKLTFYKRDLSHFTIDLAHPLLSLFRLPSVYSLLTESILNTPAPQADKRLFFKTAQMCFAAKNRQIYLANPSLLESVVQPVYDFLKDKVTFYFNQTVRTIQPDKIVSDTLEFPLTPDDRIISTIPPKTETFGTIINIHYKTDITLPDNLPVIGLVNMTPHWVFSKNGFLSVTISAANRLPTKDLADRVWEELSPLLHTLDKTPPNRILIDRRATILQTKETKRSAPDGDSPVIIAGDATDTGLPCTIEGAVRSGQKAVSLL